LAYRIKTVARLTGIPRNTLLAWERRYDLVHPTRADNGYREYSDLDIATLSAVRKLLDEGYKISEAVALVHEAREAGGDAAPSPGVLRLAVLHPTLATQLETAGSGVGEVVLARVDDDLERFTARPISGSVDVLVADLAALGALPRAGLTAAMEASGARHAVVMYSFATHAVLAQLVAAGARLVRAPARIADVLGAARGLVAFGDVRAAAPAPPRIEPDPDGDDEDVPARQFTDAQLARLLEQRSSIECECPNHLSSLASALLAFEEYSASCENQSAEDAALHSYLYRRTAHARAVVEEMLQELVEHDGLEL
jgi:DNA-binding transcriptional MerR regulator